MIQVYWNGRLGNQLFQYACGRLLAENLGYALNCPSLPGFPRTQNIIEGDVLPNFIRLTGQTLDFDLIEQNKGAYGFLLDGWFEQQEYYTPLRDRIVPWFVSNEPSTIPSEKDLVIHLRRSQAGIADTKVEYRIEGNHLLIDNDRILFGDIPKKHCELIIKDSALFASVNLVPFEWYESIIESLSFEKLYILTDCPNDLFLEYFSKYNPIILSGTNPVDDLDRKSVV